MLYAGERARQKSALNSFSEQEKKRSVSQIAEVQTMPLCSLHRALDITTIKNPDTNTMPQALWLK